jgi:hypothetical protein
MRALSRLFALIVACALCAIFALPARAQAPVDPAALLKAIAARQDQIDAYQKNLSFTDTTRVEELDKQGKVEATTVVVMHVVVKGGKTERKVVSALRDGQDETAKVRDKLEAGDKGGKDDADVGFPFGAKQQAKHRFTVVGPVPEAPGMLRVRFEPSGDRSEASIGDAIVDPATGDVSSISFTPAKLPTLVDRLNITMVFGVRSPAGLLPSVVDAYAEAGILMIKKRLRTHTELTQYTAGNP